MGSGWRIVATLVIGAVLICSDAQGQNAAPDPALGACPTADLVLEKNRLPANARPMVRLDPMTLAQPRGGKARIIISNWPGPVFQNSFTVCFRWRSAGETNSEIMATPVPVRIESVTGKEVTISAMIPDLPATYTRVWAMLISLGVIKDPAPAADTCGHTMSNLVPIADILVRINDDAGNHFDAIVGVGITSHTFAVVVTLLILSLPMLFMYRLRKFGELDLSSVIVFLRMIACSTGRASLSQFQMMLWAFVVGGGAIYVMMLTGGLIDISTGTLVLLGISGGAGLGSELGKPRDTGTTAATPTPAAPSVVPPTPWVPRWSDMVLSADGTEIDVTRVQMLFFTVITALFVTLKIITGYTIPEIPDGFQILMGLSNGVYVSKKFI